MVVVSWKRSATQMGIVCIKTTTESFQIRYCMQIYLKGHPNCQKLKDLDFQIYLIKMDYFGNFNFDFW